jgi:four helix bundle protein
MNKEEVQISRFKTQSSSQNQGSKTQNNTKKYVLRERLSQFSKETLAACRLIPNTPEYENVRRQLSRSATSIGANFEEADGALTKKDFINKVGIARKEAKETLYWFDVLLDQFNDNKRFLSLAQETTEIIKILSSILINLGLKHWSL